MSAANAEKPVGTPLASSSIRAFILGRSLMSAANVGEALGRNTNLLGTKKFTPKSIANWKSLQRKVCSNLALGSTASQFWFFFIVS